MFWGGILPHFNTWCHRAKQIPPKEGINQMSQILCPCWSCTKKQCHHPLGSSKINNSTKLSSSGFQSKVFPSEMWGNMETSETDSTEPFHRLLTPSERINSRQIPKLLTGHTNSLNPGDKNVLDWWAGDTWLKHHWQKDTKEMWDLGKMHSTCVHTCMGKCQENSESQIAPNKGKSSELPASSRAGAK